jgi:hypothetical protein
MENALVPSQRQELLRMMRDEVPAPRLPDYPTIKMRNAKSSLKEIEKGEFCLLKKVDGKEEKEITKLGTNPRVIILKRRYSYSYYDEDTDTLVAWTNELDGFNPSQVVKLARKGPNGKTVQTFTWPEFKAWKEQDPLGKLLTFRNILYVIVGEPKIENLARLFVSNASVTGVRDGDKTGSYSDPLPDSFIAFEKPISFGNSAYSEYICELGSKWLEQNEYYLTTFKVVGPNDLLDETAAVYALLRKDLAVRYSQDFGDDKTDVIDLPALATGDELPEW